MNRRLQNNEQGLVSIIVTMIMMLVITLIVLGFSQVTRTNQREALDRQLSTQAFYAAESGVNVTSATIKTLLVNGATDLPAKTTCPKDYGGTAISPLVTGSTGSDVAYTCVLVDPAPKSLQFPGVNQRSATVTPIRVAGPSALTALTIMWNMQKGGTNANCANNAGMPPTTFPTPGQWPCDYGVVRIDLVANPDNASNLAQNTRTIFLTPKGSNQGTLNVNYGTSSDKVYVGSGSSSPGTSCDNQPSCSVTINLTGISATNYYARISSIYRDTPITIKGTVGTTTPSTPASFQLAQAIIDVTGRAQDQLRRIQVRIGLSPDGSNVTPLNAVSSTSTICKTFSVIPGQTPTGPCTN